jgi:hypothetical protein
LKTLQKSLHFGIFVFIFNLAFLGEILLVIKANTTPYQEEDKKGRQRRGFGVSEPFLSATP